MQCFVVQFAVLILAVIIFSEACHAQTEGVDEFIMAAERVSIVQFQNKWPISELAAEADLIVIFEHGGVWTEVEAGEARPEEIKSDDSLRVMQCQIKALAVIKSVEEIGKEHPIKLRLVGRKSQPGYSSRASQTWLTETDERGESTVLDADNRILLGFLKIGAIDGTYEPVAGLYYSHHSFRVLKTVMEQASKIRFVEPLK